MKLFNMRFLMSWEDKPNGLIVKKQKSWVLISSHRSQTSPFTVGQRPYLPFHKPLKDGPWVEG